MSDITLADYSFPHLRNFASYLLENHLEEVAKINIKFARQVDLPLLKVFAHLSEQEFTAFVKGTLETFFVQLIEQNALEHAKETLRKWRSDTLPNIPRAGVATADLVLVYHVRKQLLLGFIEDYTTDIKEALAIAKEIDLLYAEVEQYAFSLYVDLKEAEHKEINEKLQEQQTELEEAYEELMVSREEIQQANEKLRKDAQVRIAAEEALEKERNFLKAVLENVSDGIVACDQNGVLSIFNKATRQLHGLPEKAIPAEQWSSYYSLYQADGITPLATEEIPLYRAFLGEKLKNVEMVIAPDKGSKRHIQAVGQPIISSRGEKMGAVAVMHDVTELKQARKEEQAAMLQLHEKNQELAASLEELQAAEEQLVEANDQLQARIDARTQELMASEQQIRLITDSLPVLITYVDTEERYRFVNKTFEAWFGLARTEIHGRKLEQVFTQQLGDLMGQAAYDRIKNYVHRALKGERLQFETVLRTVESGLRHVAVTYVPYIIEEEVLGYFALITDITEHKEAEKAIRESEIRFSGIFEQSSVGIAEVDLKGKFVLVNDQYCQMVGRSKEELYQLRMQDISNSKDVPGNISLFQKAIHEGIPFTIEKRYQKPDGIQVWVRNNVSVIKDTEGKPLYVVALSQDITERKQAEEGLRESEERFRNMADAAPIIIWMSNTKGENIYFNPAWSKLTGRRYEDDSVYGWEEVFHPDDIAHTWEVYGHALEHRQALSVDFRLRRYDGVYRWVHCEGSPRFSNSGEFLGFVGICEDFTERKTALDALKESEEYFRTFANNIQNLAWMAAAGGEIFWYNQRWYDYTGTSFEEMQGWGWQKVHHPDHLERVLNYISDAWRRGETWELTFPLRRADGAYGWFLTQAYAVKDSDGNVVRWIGTNTDITEQIEARQKVEKSEREAQALAEELAAANEELQAASEEAMASNEELNQTNQQLSRINADLDNFIYTASHDLRAPISNIEGLMLAMMRNLPEDSRQMHVITKLSGLISDSIDRFKRTINDLTQIAKVQRENSGEEVVLVDLTQMINEVKLDMASQIEEAEAQFETDLRQCLPIRFSNKNARSIVYNLLSNAIKYRSYNRRLKIQVSCYTEEEYQVLTVTDNGLGMDLTDQNKIFAMFKRLHDHVEGSGIGLYIVKKIVENAGGRIEVQSRLDEGTTFSVYFRQSNNS